jgi:hypothetical protein
LDIVAGKDHLPVRPCRIAIREEIEELAPAGTPVERRQQCGEALLPVTRQQGDVCSVYVLQEIGCCEGRRS